MSPMTMMAQIMILLLLLLSLLRKRLERPLLSCHRHHAEQKGLVGLDPPSSICTERRIWTEGGDIDFVQHTVTTPRFPFPEEKKEMRYGGLMPQKFQSHPTHEIRAHSVKRKWTELIPLHEKKVGINCGSLNF